jgi:hypothetical protein
MGVVPRGLAHELKKTLALERAIETGTYRGEGTRRLAELFPRVVTIELSPQYHRAAIAALRHLSNVEFRLGRSADCLEALAHERLPTLYWLDAHWSAEDTAGENDECPLLEELHAIGAGDPRDCFLIDDARLFLASPPPPHNPADWPTLAEIFDTIRSFYPDHHVTVLADMVIAVPVAAKPIVDKFSRSPARDWPLLPRIARHLLLRALARVEGWAHAR